MTFGEGKSAIWICLIIKAVLSRRPFLRRRTRASGKFPLILWAIYALFFHHRQIMSPLGA
jgi:hypothetical protein